ncbi:MAG: class I SAM-dependent methyltransferase [Chloroflexota bacterium]
MLKITDIIARERPPKPWAEGDNIPWNEPGFSRRMLHEHLSQEHDAASRRFEIIDDHVAWIHSRVLSGKSSRVLDLGCGPGLYSHRLAKLGHSCTGIDFSPASISYAEMTARAEGLNAAFTLGDVRTTEFGSGYDLAMFLYGELNVFHPNQVRDLLRRAYDSLNYGGKLLLEVSTIDGLREDLAQPYSWYGSRGGLFGDRPHLVLTENHWDDVTATKTIRYFVIHAETGDVDKFAATYQTYTDDQYRALLAGTGYVGVQRFDGLGRYVQPGLFALLATKPEWAASFK